MTRDASEVLVSLQELRDIEQRRITEEAAEKAAARAEIFRREEADRLARRRQLEEDAIRVRESEARAREIEARVKAEALVRIESERIACEAELRRAELVARRPRWMIGLAAALAAIALVTGGLAALAHQATQARTAELRDALERVDAAQARLHAQEAEERELRNAAAAYKDQLLRAQTEARALEKRLAELSKRVAPAAPPPAKKPRPPVRGNGPIEVCTDGVICD